MLNTSAKDAWWIIDQRSALSDRCLSIMQGMVRVEDPSNESWSTHLLTYLLLWEFFSPIIHQKFNIKNHPELPFPCGSRVFFGQRDMQRSRMCHTRDTHIIGTNSPYATPSYAASHIYLNNRPFFNLGSRC